MESPRTSSVTLTACVLVVTLTAFLPANADLVWTDTFDRDELGPWEVVDVGRNMGPSDWHVRDGALHQTSNIFTRRWNGQVEADWTGSFCVAQRDIPDNVRVRVVFRSTDDDGIGVVWRWKDPGNYCKFQINAAPPFWQLSKTVKARHTCLASGTRPGYKKGERYRLQVRTEGTISLVYLDDQMICGLDDADLVGGRVGVESRGNEGSHFESVQIETPVFPLDSTALTMFLREQALREIRLNRLAVLPRQDLRLELPIHLRKYLSGLIVAIESPNGSRVNTLALNTKQAPAMPPWVNREAEVGVWQLHLLENDVCLRTFSYNVWNELPGPVGVCAHRGDGRAAPENTLAAIKLAVAKGAHQIEIDVASSRDGQLVLLHDLTLDRTTDGTGKPSDHTLAKLRTLDAGGWKGEQWKGERIPTFREALETIPPWIQVNCHLKAGLGGEATREIVAMGRLDQCFLACGPKEATAARKVDPRVRICNMAGQRGADSPYPDQTILMKAQFLQFSHWSDCMPSACAKLRRHGITVNYYGTSDPLMFRQLIEAGVQYPLTDDLDAMLEVLGTMGIPPATGPLPK